MSDIVENTDNPNFGIGYEDLAKLDLELGEQINILENTETIEVAIEEDQVVVEEPVVEEQVVEEPVVVVEEPVVEEQVVEEQVVEEPVVEEQVVDEPVVVVEEPVVEEQVVEEPVVEEPVVEEPVVEEPVVEEQVVVVEEPVVVVEEPVVVEKIISEFQETQNITISIEEPVSLSINENLDQPVTNITIIPKIVFIVPYRNRESQLAAFKSHMKYILEDYNKEDYVIYYIHQTDKRVFNRGAMKNIGFIVVKNKYPNDYKNITLVFNDVDTMPVKKNLFNYDTVPGVVKHFFGFTFTLGGIVSIKAGDFEKINGFPNFWAWGYEDNLIQKRIEKIGLNIDRTIFYKIGDKNIIQRNEEIMREVNQSEYNRYMRNTPEGIYSIQNLDYSIDNESGFVNVKWFNTEYNPNVNAYRLHDLRKGPMPYDTKFGLMYNNRRIRGGRMRMGL